MSNRLNLTDKQIAEWLAACEAWAKGKPVQYWVSGADWRDYVSDIIPPLSANHLRIKPEPVEVKRWALLRADGTHFQVYNEEQMAINVCKTLCEGISADAYFVVELTGTYTPR